MTNAILAMSCLAMTLLNGAALAQELPPLEQRIAARQLLNFTVDQLKGKVQGDEAVMILDKLRESGPEALDRMGREIKATYKLAVLNLESAKDLEPTIRKLI